LENKTKMCKEQDQQQNNETKSFQNQKQEQVQDKNKDCGFLDYTKKTERSTEPR